MIAEVVVDISNDSVDRVYDYFALQKANVAGVSVIASAHFLDIKHLPKSFLEIFSRFVFIFY